MNGNTQCYRYDVGKNPMEFTLCADKIKKKIEKREGWKPFINLALVFIYSVSILFAIVNDFHIFIGHCEFL